MNYQDLEENEILSVEDEKVRQLCGGLKRIDAPKNFDFRLKARIAAHQSQTVKSPVMAFLRYAAPLGLAVAIFGAVVSNNFYSVDNAAIPQLAGSFTEKPRSEPVSPLETKKPSEIVLRNNGPSADFENETAKNSNPTLQFSTKSKNELGKIFENPKNIRPNENRGDSRDLASTQPRIITQQEFSSNKPLDSANNSTNPTSFSVKDILSAMGIAATFSGNGWKVQSVGQNSRAESSGVKPDDIIEAVNDIKIPTEMIRANSINLRKITVMRDGKKFEIVLK